MKKRLLGGFVAAALLGIGAYGVTSFTGPGKAQSPPERVSTAGATASAILAGGCFWCLEEALDKLPGILETTSGYSGGNVKNPTYAQVSAGGTGHTEVVKVVYDPAKLDYKTLLDAFWHNIDPITSNAQFCDKGSQYRAGIFYTNDKQKQLAEASKAALVKAKTFKQPIVTEITKAGSFYPAEDYHQDYYKKNPIRYKYYKYSCGRARRLERLWGPKPKT